MSRHTASHEQPVDPAVRTESSPSPAPNRTFSAFASPKSTPPSPITPLAADVSPRKPRGRSLFFANDSIDAAAAAAADSSNASSRKRHPLRLQVLQRHIPAGLSSPSPTSSDAPATAAAALDQAASAESKRLLSPVPSSPGVARLAHARDVEHTVLSSSLDSASVSQDRHAREHDLLERAHQSLGPGKSFASPIALPAPLSLRPDLIRLPPSYSRTSLAPKSPEVVRVLPAPSVEQSSAQPPLEGITEGAAPTPSETVPPRTPSRSDRFKSLLRLDLRIPTAPTSPRQARRPSWEHGASSSGPASATREPTQQGHTEQHEHGADAPWSSILRKVRETVTPSHSPQLGRRTVEPAAPSPSHLLPPPPSASDGRGTPAAQGRKPFRPTQSLPATDFEPLPTSSPRRSSAERVPSLQRRAPSIPAHATPSRRASALAPESPHPPVPPVPPPPQQPPPPPPPSSSSGQRLRASELRSKASSVSLQSSHTYASQGSTHAGSKRSSGVAEHAKPPGPPPSSPPPPPPVPQAQAQQQQNLSASLLSPNRSTHSLVHSGGHDGRRGSASGDSSGAGHTLVSAPSPVSSHASPGRVSLRHSRSDPDFRPHHLTTIVGSPKSASPLAAPSASVEDPKRSLDSTTSPTSPSPPSTLLRRRHHHHNHPYGHKRFGSNCGVVSVDSTTAEDTTLTATSYASERTLATTVDELKPSVDSISSPPPGDNQPLAPARAVAPFLSAASLSTMAPTAGGLGAGFGGGGGGDGGKWKLPFGKKHAGEGAPSSHDDGAGGAGGGGGGGGGGMGSGVKSAFMSVSMRGKGKLSGDGASRAVDREAESYDDDGLHANAHQRDRGRQRSANDARLMSVIGLLDGRNDMARQPSSRSTGSGSRHAGSDVERPREPAGGGGGPSGGGRSKLERITGEVGIDARAQARSSHAPSSHSTGSHHYADSSLPTSPHEAGVLSPTSAPHARLGGVPMVALGSGQSFTASSLAAPADEATAATGGAKGEDEQQCPVCLELLSFRLAGERPHVVPSCGHALHHACFSAVYGSPEAILAAQSGAGGAGGGLAAAAAGSGRPNAAAQPPGMCGVCRRPIVLSDDFEGRRQNKLAGMMGMPDMSDPFSRSTRDPHGLAAADGARAGDDPLEGANKVRSREALREHGAGSGAAVVGASPSFTASASGSSGLAGAGSTAATSAASAAVCHPLVRVRPEYTTVYRKDRSGENGRQNVVCVVSIETPSRRPPAFLEEYSNSFTYDGRLGTVADETFDDAGDGQAFLQDDDDVISEDHSAGISSGEHSSHGAAERPDGISDTSNEKHKASGAPTTEDRAEEQEEEEEGFSFGATPAAGALQSEPFYSVLEDLKLRIADWKGHGPDRFGSLIIYDSLGVRQESVVRDFSVYLFQEALICVTEDKRKEKQSTLARLIPERSSGSGSSTGQRVALKLKGRIWLRHIRRIQDSPIDMTISIKLDDESLDHFVLCFKEKGTMATWKAKLTELLDTKGGKGAAVAAASAGGANTGDGSTQADASSIHADKVQAVNAAAASGFASPALSADTPQRRGSTVKTGGSIGGTPRGSKHAALAHTPRRISRATSQPSIAPPPVPVQAMHQQWSASGGLDPNRPPPEMLPHAALDLVIMVSVPSLQPTSAAGSASSSSAASSSAAALKLRLIRSTLEFIVAHLGPRDRVALVTYTVGPEGEVRRTALLNTLKETSKARLEAFIGGIGQAWQGEGEDPFREDLSRLGGSSDRTDTITAVNVGLDIVLQRKSKNAVTGMILVNDTVDAPRRGQIDLVMARAEAANVPVHCFGFGKSHDPSSLWLISNHTKGSYTFVREWYQLRECLAGCVGTLMSVAISDAKLHIAVPSDNHFRVRKVAGPTGAIISSTGKDVHVELGVLCYGDVKEVLVELELDFNALVPFLAAQHGLATGSGASETRRQQLLRNKLSVPYEQGSATDDFMQRLGLEALSISDGGAQDALDGMALEHLIEEVAVLEVDASYRDAARNVVVSRMPQPALLTLEIDTHGLDPVAEMGKAGGAPGANAAAAMADPVVTRRRMELLVSDMITRSLLLVSRKNHAQAAKILHETRRIVDTVLQAISRAVVGRELVASADGSSSAARSGGSGTHPLATSASGSSLGHHGRASVAATGGPRRQRDALHRRTVESLAAILEDLDALCEGLEQSPTSHSSFERSEKNLGAQQSMVLRDQRAFTSRTDTEWRHVRRVENASAFTFLSAIYAGGSGAR